MGRDELYRIQKMTKTSAVLTDAVIGVDQIGRVYSFVV